MQKRSLLLLVGATLLLVAAAIYAVASGDRAVSLPPHGGRALPGLAAKLGDLAWLRLVRGAMTVDFTAIDGGWVVVERGNYKAAPQRMRQLLLGLADLTLLEPKTKRLDRLGRLDLDDPKHGRSTLVALQDRTGKTVGELIIGKSRPDLLGGGNGGIYVRKPGDDQAWLARGALDLAGGITGWLDRRILDIAPARIAALTLTAADGVALTLRAAPDGAFTVAGAPAGTRFKDAAALAAPAGALADLALADVQPAAQLPVPKSGVASALFTTVDGLTVTLRLFVHDKTDWLAVAASGQGAAAAEARAINARLAPWTYAIPAERAQLLRTRLTDLVMPAKGS